MTGNRQKNEKDENTVYLRNPRGARVQIFTKVFHETLPYLTFENYPPPVAKILVQRGLNVNLFNVIILIIGLLNIPTLSIHISLK